MVNRSDNTPASRQVLSSLMDGALPPEGADDAFAVWRTDPDARISWHAYHLIGDVLRSDDLATRPAGDEAFLQALRARLADEPVPLAPAPLLPRQDDSGTTQAPAGSLALAARPRRSGRRLGWMAAPAAVAAGFVAVVGVVVVTRVMSPEPSAGPMLAATSAAAPPGARAASGMLVRDARLDRYLSAHRSLANGAVAAGAGEHRMQIVFEGQ